MKFNELKYERVTVEQIREQLNVALEAIKNAKCGNCIVKAHDGFMPILMEYHTAASLSYCRFTLNMNDEFYKAENDYYNEANPEISSMILELEKAILASPFRAEAEELLSPVLFKNYEVSVKSVDPAIVPDMIEENKVTTEYAELMAGLEFEFDGKTMTRAELMKYAKDADRDVRRRCYETLGTGLEKVSDKLDDIYDRLVHIRDRMAKKMGYKNFVELGYYRMGRICYDRDMVEKFRNNVLKDIVPVVARLRTENAKKLGIDGQFMLYDNDVAIAGGDPTPGTKEEIFAAAKEMYHAMSPESAKFIDMMLENDAFDVEPRKGKWGGGYCTEFSKYRQPFILANFNGTAGDVDVVTHEAGHAFNAFLIADNRFALELQCGGMETAETHSMSMEFFAWKYMDKFFGDRAEEYKFMHALDAFTFIPYGTIVDKFQHIVYENPDMTPAERDEAWKKLEAEYRPWLSIEGIPYIEKGTRWQYQMHIFESPFYYIDYVIAQTVAFEFLLALNENYDDAFARYIQLSKHGGEMLYTDLLKEAGLKSPFEDGALADVAAGVEKLLNGIKH